jgi:enoyl-CoA hydratase/carnithine racemase
MKFDAVECSTGEVTLELVSPHVALVTLNRPQVCNTVNQALSRRMMRVISQTEMDDEIRAVVLTGAGEKAFCAGADLHEIGSEGGWNIAYGPAGFANFVYAERKKPWIAAVRGYALGGGTEIATACEMIVAGDSATFGLPEVKRCLVPGAGGLFRLPRRIPRAVANELVLTGEPISAERALQVGLINRVVPADQVVAEAIRVAERIAGNAPLAVRESLSLLRMSEARSEGELARDTVRAIGRLMHCDDFQEGPRAFLEDRSPRWVGH